MLKTKSLGSSPIPFWISTFDDVVVVVVVVEEVDGEVSKKLHWDTNHVQAVTLWLSALPLSYLNRDKEGRYYPVLELGVIPLVHLWRHEKRGTVLN